jgi:uncharacterized membrane protein
MSGIAVIVIVLLAFLVVVGGSIFIFGLSRSERAIQSDDHRADSGQNSPDGNQRQDSSGD